MRKIFLIPYDAVDLRKLEYSEVFFLKLSAILFYSENHCKPLKLCSKFLDRHIPQKIKEFGSLALGEGTPSSVKNEKHEISNVQNR